MALSAVTGLEGVVVADTALSEVDGERGRLVIAGHDVERLAGTRSFEALCRELWAAVPGATSELLLREALGRERVWAFGQIEGLGRALHAADGMDALRGALAQLPADLLTLGETNPTLQIVIVAVASLSGPTPRRVMPRIWSGCCGERPPPRAPRRSRPTW